LAKDGPTGSKSHVSTRVMGTHGYAAPEYMATGIFQITTLVMFTFLIPASCGKRNAYFI